MGCISAETASLGTKKILVVVASLLLIVSILVAVAVYIVPKPYDHPGEGYVP